MGAGWVLPGVFPGGPGRQGGCQQGAGGSSAGEAGGDLGSALRRAVPALTIMMSPVFVPAPVLGALDPLRPPWVHWAGELVARLREQHLSLSPRQVAVLGREFRLCARVWPLALVLGEWTGHRITYSPGAHSGHPGPPAVSGLRGGHPLPGRPSALRHFLGSQHRSILGRLGSP